MLSLHTLKKSKAGLKSKKRIGRGNSSGSGTYSGKGQKGQKARSGVSNLKRLGMKQVLLRTPKLRGFKSTKPKLQNVNLEDLSKNFKEGDKIDVRSLFEKKLISTMKTSVKILGDGKLSIAKIKISGITASKSAKDKIEKKGGKIS